jgi:hypothetical protein
VLKFFRIRSKIFINFTWLLLFALFADAVNLDDYLPNSCSIHLDDIDMINNNVVDDMLMALTGSSGTLSKEAKNVEENTQKQPKKDVVILYDLDSLCLAANSSFEKETVLSQSFRQTEIAVTAASTKKESTQNLFLLFQSLVI